MAGGEEAVLVVGVLAVVFVFIRIWNCIEGIIYQNESTHLEIQSTHLESTCNESSRIPNLNLHGLTAREAEYELQQFLEDHYNQYIHGNADRNRKVNINTGRGIHSGRGEPVLKPITERYLRDNYRKYWWDEPGGVVTVDLSSKN